MSVARVTDASLCSPSRRMTAPSSANSTRSTELNVVAFCPPCISTSSTLLQTALQTFSTTRTGCISPHIHPHFFPFRVRLISADQSHTSGTETFKNVADPFKNPLPETCQNVTAALIHCTYFMNARKTPTLFCILTNRIGSSAKSYPSRLAQLHSRCDI